eukprot:1348322-Pleurochrysis_carterae.AAC.2
MDDLRERKPEALHYASTIGLQSPPKSNWSEICVASGAARTSSAWAWRRRSSLAVASSAATLARSVSTSSDLARPRPCRSQPGSSPAHHGAGSGRCMLVPVACGPQPLNELCADSARKTQLLGSQGSCKDEGQGTRERRMRRVYTRAREIISSVS